jgi:hypothetical protein
VAGLHPDIPTAVGAMVRVAATITPDPAAVGAYQGPYARYKALYPALKGVFHAAAAEASATPKAAAKADSGPAAVPAAAAAAAPAAAAVQALAPSRPVVAAAAAVAAPPGTNSPSPSPSSSRPPLRIAPSILAADFAALGEAVRDVVAGGAEWVHVDMFDGTWAPNFTLGPPVVAALRRAAPGTYLDCHLAVAVRGWGGGGG